MSRLGDAIRKARLQAKMSEKQLGRKCGMAENVIKDIESGRRIIADDQAQRILKDWANRRRANRHHHRASRHRHRHQGHRLMRCRWL